LLRKIAEDDDAERHWLSAAELARRVLRFPLDYVPTIDRVGKFLRVVARRAYVSRALRQVADA
jgi:hypothetical protein